MTFKDIFKSGFLDKIIEFSVSDMIIALLLAFAIGLFIFLVYKKTYTGVMYSASFGLSLLGMTLITTFIIMAVTSNVVLSLGMVGALSIVRFRTAIKDPLDTVFIFWAISVGIVLGAGLIPHAILGALLIGIVLTIFANKKSSDNPYILVVNLISEEVEKDVLSIIGEKVKRFVIKSKTVQKGNNIELSVEVRLKDGSTDFINEICRSDGVNNAVLVSYNGEYMG